MADLEQRVGELERIVQGLTELASLQGDEIERLRRELSDEITSRALESLPDAGRYARLGSAQPDLGLGRYELQR